MSDARNSSKKNNSVLSIPRGHSLGEFRTHTEATEFVNRLVAGDFKANKVTILGHDLVMVEKVRSRLGYGRVAASGAMTGFWLGVIFALIIGAGVDVGISGEINYVPQEFFAVIVIAAGVGMLVNILRFLASKNKRGFLSSQMPVAAKYEVIVPEEDAAKAMQIINMSRDLS
ncbi:MAG: hypothetical protein QMB74_05455 [Aquiluna sp.]